MYCVKCGAEVKDGAKFCSACGAPTKNVTALQVTEQDIVSVKTDDTSDNEPAPEVFDWYHTFLGVV